MEAVFRPELSLRDGGVATWYSALTDYNTSILKAATKYYGFAFDEFMPLRDYDEVQRDLLYFGVESEQFNRHFPDVKPPKSVGQGKYEG